jgi:hypothetical protein
MRGIKKGRHADKLRGRCHPEALEGCAVAGHAPFWPLRAYASRASA